jgi:hypothetical protein
LEKETEEMPDSLMVVQEVDIGEVFNGFEQGRVEVAINVQQEEDPPSSQDIPVP